MPYIRVVTPNGQNYQISSSDPELIGKWFVETINRESSPEGSYYGWQVYISAIYVPEVNGRTHPDWCPETPHFGHHEFTFGGQLESLIAALEKMRHET